MNPTELTKSPSEVVMEQTSDLYELVEDTLSQYFFQDDHLARNYFLALLRSFYDVCSPLQNRRMPILKSRLPKFDYDSRAIRVRQDLKQLGVNNAKIDHWELISASDLIEFTGIPELLGCLYVVEGSEMGNHVMRSQLDDLLPVDCLVANDFFRDNGVETRKLLCNFKLRLDKKITSRSEFSRLIHSACDTFKLFQKGF